MSNPNDDGGGLRPALPSRWQVAVHEAAHAVYAHRQGVTVVFVTVEGIVAAENGGISGGYLGRCRPDWDGENGPLTGVLGCALSLVGLAAAFRAGWPEPLLPYPEFVLEAQAKNPRSDAGQVFALLRSADDPEGLYEAARAEAEASVDEHWSEIVALAERLMEAETLTEREVDAALGRPGWGAFREMLDEMRLAEDAAPWTKGEGEETF
ncbi:MAG: hypothetical protein CYG60_19825 [Actinobacteria bacterium]|nr:MAG: hypothetical protein CYG60_19825 [Actinomycetota bacterium]